MLSFPAFSRLKDFQKKNNICRLSKKIQCFNFIHQGLWYAWELCINMIKINVPKIWLRICFVLQKIIIIVQIKTVQKFESTGTSTQKVAISSIFSWKVLLCYYVKGQIITVHFLEKAIFALYKILWHSFVFFTNIFKYKHNFRYHSDVIIAFGRQLVDEASFVNLMNILVLQRGFGVLFKYKWIYRLLIIETWPTGTGSF